MNKKRLLSVITAIFMAMTVLVVPVSETVYGAMDPGSAYTSGVEGGAIYYEVDEESGNVTITGCDASVTSVVIPNTIDGRQVTSIGDVAFTECRNLKSVTIPDGVMNIGNGTFWFCESLTDVTIPSSMVSIGDLAFRECKSLTSVVIPEGVEEIGAYAFWYCSSLTDIEIPASVTSIGEGAFLYCRALKEFTVAANNPSYVSENGVLFDKQKTTLIQYPLANQAERYEIPQGVKKIDQQAFEEAVNLTEINIPDSVTSIEGRAFASCSGLTEIVIPDSVTSLGRAAFGWCSGATSVTIPNGLKEIGMQVFEGCAGLTSVTIPDSVKSIDFYAFCYCPDLERVTIPDNVTSIADNTFEESERVTIYGYTGSYAEAYAGKLKIPFESIGTAQIVYVPGKVKSLKVKSTKKKVMTVTWKRDKMATGYQITYAQNKNFKNAKNITVKKNSATKKTIKKLRSGKNYYVKIRAYRQAGKTKNYGKYTAVKWVNVK